MSLPLQYSSDSVVYDPTIFIACKLVVVAWLIAYGAAMKPRAPVEQLPHGDAARHVLVSRLLTKLHRHTIFYTNILLGNIRVFQTRNPQWVDEIVFSQGKQENVVLEEERMTWS